MYTRSRGFPTAVRSSRAFAFLDALLPLLRPEGGAADCEGSRVLDEDAIGGLALREPPWEADDGHGDGGRRACAREE